LAESLGVTIRQVTDSAAYDLLIQRPEIVL
jgi:hypothetical protein